MPKTQIAILLLLMLWIKPLASQEKHTLQIKKPDSLNTCHLNLEGFTMQNLNTLPDAGYSIYFSPNLLEVVTKLNTISNWKIHDYELSLVKPGDTLATAVRTVGAADTFSVLCKLMNEAEKGSKIYFTHIKIINSGSTVILEDNVMPMLITKNRE